jgi:hypothetical protein
MTGRSPIVALLTIVLVGCSATLDPMAGDRSEVAQLSSYAATAKYPAEAEARRDMPIAVLTKGDSLRLINFTDKPVRDSDVWVNGTFVRHVDVIPPMGSVTLKRSEFYDSTGQNLKSAASTATRVTIQSGDAHYATLGPAKD